MRERLKNETDHTILTHVLSLIAQEVQPPVVNPNRPNSYYEVHSIAKRSSNYYGGHYEGDGHDHTHNEHRYYMEKRRNGSVGSSQLMSFIAMICSVLIVHLM